MKKHKIFKDEKGQAFVQFALLFPILIIMLSVLVDVWRVVDAKMLIQSVASETALHIVEYSDSANIDKYNDYKKNVLENELKGRLDLSKLKLTIEEGNLQNDKYRFHSSSRDYYGKEYDYLYRDYTVKVEYVVDIVMPLSRIAFRTDKFRVNSKFVTRVGEK